MSPRVLPVQQQLITLEWASQILFSEIYYLFYSLPRKIKNPNLIFDHEYNVNIKHDFSANNHVCIAESLGVLYWYKILEV